MGWCSAIVSLNLTPIFDLEKWIDDFNIMDLPCVLQVFGIERPASGLNRGANDHSVPVGELMQLMEIDRGKDIIEGWLKS